jgi:hypothetical protein
MNARLKKILLLLLAAVLLAGVSQVQRSLLRDRNRLGLTRVEPLENAPPVLAFTTVALGGFRGLISNMLWIRATELQDEDKFFEMKQLADWITKLEPHFVQVWLVQAWNMAYNISVKFKETEYGQYPDRWRWVKAGIELLRDQGLHYNPYEPLLYRELAWFFQHKMGHNLDDANMYYKQHWANEMSQVFGLTRPNFDELIKPQTSNDFFRLNLLTNIYKMDPKTVKDVDAEYGPLEWRLPEAHAIYWAARGLDAAKLNERRIDPDLLIQLRRAIYQSMQLSFHRGRMVPDFITQRFEFGPNLDIIPKVNFAYEQAMEDDAKNRDHIKTGHRNFLRDAVYFLYTHGREREAARWYRVILETYPDKTMLDGLPNSFPRNLTLDQYCVGRVAGDVTETDRNRIKQTVEGMLARSFERLILDQDEEAEALRRLAEKVHETYLSKIKERQMAIGLPPFAEIRRDVLNRLLDPENGLPLLEQRNVLRTKLGLPAEATRPAPSTNAPPMAVTSTNKPGLTR